MVARQYRSFHDEVAPPDASLTSGNVRRRWSAERVRYAAGCTGTTLDEAWLETFKELLSDLIDRGIVLGSRALPAA